MNIRNHQRLIFIAKFHLGSKETGIELKRKAPFTKLGPLFLSNLELLLSEVNGPCLFCIYSRVSSGKVYFFNKHCVFYFEAYFSRYFTLNVGGSRRFKGLLNLFETKHKKSTALI